MKFHRMFPKKPQKLRATARAVSKEADDFDEPNMKLSSAFIVVLLLHVVAVGGIYAFNSIKVHQIPQGGSSAPVRAESSRSASVAVANSTETQKLHTAKPVQETHAQAEAKKPADQPEKHALKDSGETYTVVKGDNPHAIARRLHVSYDELLKLNKIDDPKKLQIGQKLRVPTKTKAN